MRRLALAFLSTVALAGCGGGEGVRFAEPQLLLPGVAELDGADGVGFQLEVRVLRLERSSWSVEASVVNRTGIAWRIGRPHVPGGTKFGLIVVATAEESEWRAMVARGQVTPALIASRFVPEVPELLRPGASWRGVFSGPGRLPAGSYVRFAFGRFTATAEPPRGLPWRLIAVTERSLRIPPGR